MNKEELLSLGSTTLEDAIKKVPQIHFHDDHADLMKIPHRNHFKLIFSSHALEHQTDLVRHFEKVSALLTPGGFYTMFVPNKRFYFDHFIAPSTIANVLGDYFHGRTRHKLESVVEHRALTTHNHPVRHWTAGNDHGEQALSRLQEAINEWVVGNSTGNYIDVHNYQFTPESLWRIMEALLRLGLTDLSVHRLYPSQLNSNEFGVVLKKGHGGGRYWKGPNFLSPLGKPSPSSLSLFSKPPSSAP
jgi:hypothetical protein